MMSGKNDTTSSCRIRVPTAEATKPTGGVANHGEKKTWAEMDKGNIPLGKLIEGFALYNQTTNKSPRTVAWYSERLGLLGLLTCSRSVLTGWRTNQCALWTRPLALVASSQLQVGFIKHRP